MDKGEELVERVRKTNEYIENKYFNKQGGNMDEENKPKEVKNASRIIDLMLELRKARETIESQLKEIKTQAKSKISALRTSENTLLDSLEEKDQMTLFEVDPQVSEEVQEIIENPII